MPGSLISPGGSHQRGTWRWNFLTGGVEILRENRFDSEAFQVRFASEAVIMELK